ncbi:SCO family protein [Hydrogenophaga sp. IBVHS1]|uniref:SCO family protein n=1 Tax=unclassified Hydrogenophaga TaxID=2610897 RepID=UPI000A2E0B45|nr:SCO family protein [Hydrogenophaga sp. IBVHS1]OSZ75484.1 electron transporter SenC [Hydrogenophaga sp. IBVHS1]
MKRTAFACVVFALLSYAAAQWLTLDFKTWTAEGARRMEIAARPLPAPPVDMEGPGVEARTLAQLLSDEGAVTIVDFMYTRCVTVCAALGTAFQQMQSAIASHERASSRSSRVRLLSITFDPEHDDPGVLAAYATRLQADPRIWRFARVVDSAKAGVGPRLLDHYQVTVIPDGLGGFEHNAALLVVDPTGRLVRVFDYSDLDTALAFARALADRGAV